MANELDEITGPVNNEGRDVNVIEKQLKVEISAGTKIFDIAIWVIGLGLGVVVGYVSTGQPMYALLGLVVGSVPGLIFWVMKTNALAYLRQLAQKIQADASQIDNYLEQRVVILENLAGLLDKSIDLDKDVMKTVAAYRGGISPNADSNRNDTSALLDGISSRINLAFEAYPELKAQANIAEGMRQNSNLQKEITAARTLYNDTVASWNREIYSWPTKQIVAAKQEYTTRIPFRTSPGMEEAARGKFF